MGMLMAGRRLDGKQVSWKLQEDERGRSPCKKPES